MTMAIIVDYRMNDYRMKVIMIYGIMYLTFFIFIFLFVVNFVIH